MERINLWTSVKEERKGERQDKGRRLCKQTPRPSFVDVRGSLGPRMNDYFLKQSSTERRHKLQYEKPLTGESVTAKVQAPYTEWSLPSLRWKQIGAGGSDSEPVQVPLACKSLAFTVRESEGNAKDLAAFLKYARFWQVKIRTLRKFQRHKCSASISIRDSTSSIPEKEAGHYSCSVQSQQCVSEWNRRLNRKRQTPRHYKTQHCCLDWRSFSSTP